MEGVDQRVLGRGINEGQTNVGLRRKRMETIFTTRYYRLNRFFLSIVGIWPYDDPRDSLIRKISTYIGFTMIVLSQIFALIKSDLTLRMISTIFAFLIPSLCLFTSYHAAGYHDKMKAMFEHMNYDWCHLISEKERSIIEKYANHTRICTIVNL
ncbi:odorant receptor 22c-like, partial [Vespula squamosa]